MGVEITFCCTTCKEMFWAGSYKTFKWSGFQFSNRQVFSWFARHSSDKCHLVVGLDISIYPWEVNLSTEEYGNWKHMGYDIETHTWKCFGLEKDDFDDYYPNYLEEQIKQPTCPIENRKIQALAFSVKIIQTDCVDFEDDWKNSFTIKFDELLNPEIAENWASWITGLYEHREYELTVEKIF